MGRLLLALLGVNAFEQGESVVAALKHKHSFVDQGEYSCPLTGSQPFARDEEANFCSGWIRGVCCSSELLAALQPVVQDAARRHAPTCPGCAKNWEAAVCALACSPEVVQPSPQAFRAVLSVDFCEEFDSSCESVQSRGYDLATGGCARAVALVSQFFGPTELELVHRSSLDIRASTQNCERERRPRFSAGFVQLTPQVEVGPFVPARHRGSDQMASILVFALYSALSTFGALVTVYALGSLLVRRCRQVEVLPQKEPVGLGDFQWDTVQRPMAVARL